MNLIVSEANKAIVAPSTMGVRNLFPDAPTLPDGNTVIPHGMRETLLLRHLGFKCPNPLLMYYKWPFEPFAVQKATFKMLTENPRAYVLNDMGTGKTRTALAAWDAMNTAGLCGKLLVVAPLSTLNFVWGRECYDILPKRTYKVLHGTKKERLAKLAEDADIYIINHDGLRTIAPELAKRIDITALVLDELAVYRNNSDRSKLMRKFAARFPVVWGLTGAPMPNAPTDVWGQARIITPNAVPRYFRDVQAQLMVQVSQYQWRPKATAIKDAFHYLQPSVRFSLDEVVELPPMVERYIDVNLTVEQENIYNKIKNELAAMIRGGQVTAMNAAAAMGKLLQVSGGWVYTRPPDHVRLDASARVVALIDLIQAAERKVIVFIPYRHMIEGISKIIDPKSGIAKIDHCVVHGDTKNREEIFTAFQHTDKYKVMLAHPGTIHHGLTLTAADTNIWYLPIANLDIFQQANARIRRVGQKHKQQLLMMCGSPVERRLYSLLRGKELAQLQLLDLLEIATGDADERARA